MHAPGRQVPADRRAAAADRAEQQVAAGAPPGERGGTAGDPEPEQPRGPLGRIQPLLHEGYRRHVELGTGRLAGLRLPDALRRTPQVGAAAERVSRPPVSGRPPRPAARGPAAVPRPDPPEPHARTARGPAAECRRAARALREAARRGRCLDPRGEQDPHGTHECHHRIGTKRVGPPTGPCGAAGDERATRPWHSA